jgi:hypothetical protein
MIQPVGAYIPTKITQGAGSTIISADPCTFHSLVTFGTVGGTTSFYDSSTVAGTAASNLIFTFNQVAGVGTVPQAALLDFRTRKGLVAITSGTVDFVVSTG